MYPYLCLNVQGLAVAYRMSSGCMKVAGNLNHNISDIQYWPLLMGREGGGTIHKRNDYKMVLSISGKSSSAEVGSKLVRPSARPDLARTSSSGNVLRYIHQCQ